MKMRRIATYVVCVLSIFLIFFVCSSAKISMNAAAAAGGRLSLNVMGANVASEATCGNDVCEAGETSETCAHDCAPSGTSNEASSNDVSKKFFQIRTTSYLLIFLIVMLCVLTYIYFKKEKKQKTEGYWQYGT